MVKVFGRKAWFACLLAVAAFGMRLAAAEPSLLERLFLLGPAHRAYQHAQLAHEYSVQGDLTNAIKHCDLAISANMGYDYAYGLRATCYARAGHHAEALADCNRLIDQGSIHSSHYELRARLLVRKGDMTHALADCERAIRLNPDRAYAHGMKGWILLEQQKHGPARAALSRAIAIRPESGLLYLRRAAACRDLGAFASACDDIEKARELGCRDRHAELMLVTIAGSSGRVKDALEVCDRLLKGAPDDVEVLNAKAYVLCTARDEASRNGEEALRLAKRAVEWSADRRKIPYILDTLACAHAECGNFDAAVAIEREVVGYLPDDVEIRRHLERFEGGQAVREPEVPTTDD